MTLIRITMLILLVAAMVTVNGCAVTPEPLEYQPDNELKSGPGLLSGEDGVFTIYRKPNESDADKASQEPK